VKNYLRVVKPVLGRVAALLSAGRCGESRMWELLCSTAEFTAVVDAAAVQQGHERSIDAVLTAPLLEALKSARTMVTHGTKYKRLFRQLLSLVAGRRSDGKRGVSKKELVKQLDSTGLSVTKHQIDEARKHAARSFAGYPDRRGKDGIRLYESEYGTDGRWVLLGGSPSAVPAPPSGWRVLLTVPEVVDAESLAALVQERGGGSGSAIVMFKWEAPHDWHASCLSGYRKPKGKGKKGKAAAGTAPWVNGYVQIRSMTVEEGAKEVDLRKQEYGTKWLLAERVGSGSSSSSSGSSGGGGGRSNRSSSGGGGGGRAGRAARRGEQ
jgi:hypothetical protein